ncbi:flagellar biosynthesis regulator [Oryzomicrobium terrae]|uniref:Flagellar biosynthesis protein FlhF n=1 Tax=Oryzomicrobium terrae TaxID=1735038 RepID=A0A5C1E813_9RHOO|nr:flagellar biosynthesis protein FlhF [Oryzomicrobium terrae]QEL64358.1 flagellar biosynthesis regulator [Oryzomicrobium terrae]
MNVKKFIAANAREALRKVKETLGADAIILSNRGVAGGVEIMAVAARDMAAIAPGASRDEQGLSRPNVMPRELENSDDYSVSLSAARKAATAPVRPTPMPLADLAGGAPPAPEQRPAPARSLAPEAAYAPFRQIRQENRQDHGPASRNAELPRAPQPSHEPAAASELRRAIRPEAAPRMEEPAVSHAVMDELRALRKVVEQHLAGFSWAETGRTEPGKTQALAQLLDAGFSPQFARDLLSGLPSGLDATQAMMWVKGAADRSLMTLSSDADIIEQGGVYALVGPTGVGKTTTTAKLAARCVVRHGAAKVALVTTDGYRIGAHEQLRIYGRILGVSVHLVRDAADLRQTLAELSHKHMVLIDTMGMSQKDKHVQEQIAMLVSGGSVRRLLLLSATSRGDTLDDVIRAYRGEQPGDGVAGCILTKVDEAASLATSLDAVIRHGLSLHYVSNGQRVPEDLHLPNRNYLLHRAFRDVPGTSPHRYSGVESTLVMANAGLSTTGGGHG